MTIDYLAALAADTAGHTSTSEAVLFWVFGAVALVGAVGVVAAQKAVYSAMFLASTMIALAALYIAQDALFLGVVQVVVYTGAVMMLFLFVLMLIGVDTSEALAETLRGQRMAAMVIGFGFGTPEVGSLAVAPRAGARIEPVTSGMLPSAVARDSSAVCRFMICSSFWSNCSWSSNCRLVVRSTLARSSAMRSS